MSSRQKGFPQNHSSAQTEQAVSAIQSLLGPHAMGIYLYGSSVLGGLQANSDIDILVIADERPSGEIRARLTEELLRISGRIGCGDSRPLEVTIVNYGEIASRHYPPRYEYMYGEWLREGIEAGEVPQPGYDADLLILLWQARERSIALMGADAYTLIPPVSDGEIDKAIRDALTGVLEGISGDERNALLTLARMWYTLETHELCAKNTAAEWTISRLPSEFVPLMEMAIGGYLGERKDDWSDKSDEVLLLADHMKRIIESH